MPNTRRSNSTDSREMVREEDIHIVETDEHDRYEGILSMNIKDFISINMMLELWNLTKIYLFWIFVHIMSVNLYCYCCAYPSLYGFLISPFIAVAPHCRALSWLMTNSITSINNMWLTLGTWCVTRLTFTNNN